MTIFQLHLEVNQRLQEVASYKRDKFKPEEIDLALNKAMYRLLEKGVESKFQDTQVNLSHVTALIHKNKIEEVLIPGSTEPLYEESLLNGYSLIPPDFYWLVNCRTEILTDPLNCSTAPDLDTTTRPEYTAVVPFPALDTAPYYNAVTISSNVTGTWYTSPSAITTGFTNANSKYVVIHNILETLYRKYPTLKVYWERFRDIHYPDSFIFVSSIPIGTVTMVSGNQSSIVASTTTNYTIYNRSLINGLTSKKVDIAPTSPLQEDILYSSLKKNSFYSTISTEPILAQTQDYLILYRDESFLITRLYIDYIRKPKTISLILNQTCELADTTHPKLVDLAIEILRLDTKDQSYQATVQDTQLRTN